jgi:hypothetical protein
VDLMVDPVITHFKMETLAILAIKFKWQEILKVNELLVNKELLKQKL